MKKRSFEENLEILEQIVEDLESGDLTLEEAMERYERGVAAHKECMATLNAAEKRIEVLLKDADGKLETRPLEKAGSDAQEAAE